MSINSFTSMDATHEAALRFDASDPLAEYRKRFHIPRTESGKEVIYLTGNSLGLQPDTTRSVINELLDDWAAFGVEGHFKAKHAWMPYHELLTEPMADIVGACPSEVVIMNSLTVNLHLLMASFFRPLGKRTKILIEHHAFPSDRYAVRSHLEWHGLDPEEHLLIAGREANRDVLEESDIESLIAAHADELALVLIGGVNYYSGQRFDMPHLTRLAHSAGARVGFDLAHGAGNVPLALHDWNVDFAAWCTYKYLNAGPGGPAGIFVHQRHGSDASLNRLSGWWGHDKSSRFAMPDEYLPIKGAEGWQMSNPSILAMAGLRASLMIFKEVGMKALHRKSELLTGYTEFLVRHELSDSVDIITPSDPSRRGAQLSLRVKGNTKGTLSAGFVSEPVSHLSTGRQIFNYLESNGVICDWREPDVIRLAPIPLYSSFEDVFTFVQILKTACSLIQE